MRANELRHMVTFQRRGTTQDALGGQTTGWTNVVSMRAKIASLSGREVLAAQANQIELTHTITLRYQALFADPKAVAAMRVLYGARVFNIHAAIDVDQRRREIELSCSEGLNDG